MATELATRPPAFVDGKTQSANDMRLNILSGSGGATPLQSRAGVRPSGGNPGLVAALPTPVMKIRVNAGIADVPSASVTGGFYRVSWDQVDLDIDPSSAQSRTDLIIVEVVDTGTSAATGKVRVLKGTSGAGRPTNGVVNAHWWSLGSVAVRVNAEGTGNIRPQDVTPELQYAVAPGGIIPVHDQDERDAITAYPAVVHRLDTDELEKHGLSGGWAPVVDQITTGSVTLDGALYKPAALPTAPISYVRHGRRMSLQGSFTHVPAAFNAPTGTIYTFGSVPAGTAPAADQIFVGYCWTGSANEVMFILVDADGALQYVGPSLTTGMSVSVGGISWQIGG